LGSVDHALVGNEFDPSDQDGGIHFGNWPVLSLLQPDAIASFEIGGVTYFATANEGDARIVFEDATVKRINSADYTLDPTVFPDAASLDGEQRARSAQRIDD
jgi:Choice-of-anchor I domain